MGQKLVEFSLVDKDGARIQTAGGAVIVCAAGTPNQLAVVTTSGGTLATSNNPVALTNGNAKFYVADTVASLDLYGFAPGGQPIVINGLVPSGPNEIVIDTGQTAHVAKIPWSVTDQAGDATETDTGLDIPANSILPGTGTAVVIVDIDAAITVDIGTAGTSNDPNGFIAAASTATATAIPATGALSVSTGSPVVKVIGGDSITYTILTAADTATGFLILPYYLYA